MLVCVFICVGVCVCLCACVCVFIYARQLLSFFMGHLWEGVNL